MIRVLAILLLCACDPVTSEPEVGAAPRAAGIRVAATPQPVLPSVEADEADDPDEADADTDTDHIVDVADQCPDDPEDRDGFEDDDGCPDPDVDVDPVLDVEDRCPNLPAGSEFEDLDSCPD
jgi:hypothetical protein